MEPKKGLMIQVAVWNNHVLLDFTQQIQWVALSISGALELSDALINYAKILKEGSMTTHGLN